MCARVCWLKGPACDYCLAWCMTDVDVQLRASCTWRAPLWPVFCMPPAHLCLWLCLPLHGPFTPVRAVPVPIPTPVPARGLCVRV